MKIKEIAKKMKNDGYYLVCITAIDLKRFFEIIYHFSNEKDLKVFRFLVRKEEEVPSISDIFPNAFIYEWEERESIGTKFDGAKRLFGEKDG